MSNEKVNPNTSDCNTNTTNRVATKEELVKALYELPEEFVLTPVNGKKISYRTGWSTEEPLSRDVIANEIRRGVAKGFGLRFGAVSGGIMAIDADGEAAHEKIRELNGGDLPKTVCFTSGKPGRCQYLFRVPKEYWGIVEGRIVLPTGVKDKDGKDEDVELRSYGHQSVLPPSRHPETGAYFYINSYTDTEFATIPMWVVEEFKKKQQLAAAKLKSNSTKAKAQQELGDEAKSFKQLKKEFDLVDEYLAALKPERADSYTDWVNVGMALHSQAHHPDLDVETSAEWDEALYEKWDAWSQQSDKYDGDTRKKWDSFNESKGVTLGTLGQMAKEDGWEKKVEVIKPSNSSVSERIRELLLRGVSIDGEEFYELRAEVFSSKQMLVNDFNALVQKHKQEIDREDSREDFSSTLQDLIALKNKKISARRILPSDIAQVIEILSSKLGFREEAYIGALLTGISSMHKPGTTVEIWEATEWEVTLNVFFFLHGGSASGKSPVAKAVIQKPINAYRKELKATQDAAMEDWKQRCIAAKQANKPEPEKPHIRVFFTTDYTTQAVTPLLAKQPDAGLLIYADELETLIENLNRYSGGNGGDRPFLQSLVDGNTSMSSLRVSSGNCNVEQHNVALYGNLPTEILTNYLVKTKDSGGLWARFACCEQQAVYKNIDRTDRTKHDITPRLTALYKAVDSLPKQVYKLHRESEPIVDTWIDFCGNQSVNPETPEALRKVWGKQKELFAKILGNIHVIWYVGQGQIPPEIIPPQIALAALEYSQFCFAQTCLVYSDLITTKEEIAPELLKFLQKAQNISSKKGVEWMKVAEIHNTYGREQKLRHDAACMKGWVKELEAMGYVETREIETKSKVSFQFRLLEKKSEKKDFCTTILERFSAYADMSKIPVADRLVERPIAPVNNTPVSFSKELITKFGGSDEEFDFATSPYNSADFEPATAKGADAEQMSAIATEPVELEVQADAEPEESAVASDCQLVQTEATADAADVCDREQSSAIVPVSSVDVVNGELDPEAERRCESFVFEDGTAVIKDLDRDAWFITNLSRSEEETSYKTITVGNSELLVGAVLWYKPNTDEEAQVALLEALESGEVLVKVVIPHGDECPFEIGETVQVSVDHLRMYRW